MLPAQDPTTSAPVATTRNSPNFKHGDAGSRLHRIWAGMRKRCFNAKADSHRDYGGRGISICPEWDHYPTFRVWALANGYRDDLTIERKDVNGDYGPSNCEWITRERQARNKRSTRLVTAFGETKCVAEWLEDPRCAIGCPRIYQRLDGGWVPEEAISTPAGHEQPSVRSLREAWAASFSPDYSNESWLPIPGWPGYDVSDCGRVRSYWRKKVIARPPGEGWRKRGKVLSVIGDVPTLKAISIDETGRPRVDLSDGKGGRKTFLLSNLVLMAFVGPRPPGMFAHHHPDPTPCNCTLGNLSWATRAEIDRDMKAFRLAARQIAAGIPS